MRSYASRSRVLYRAASVIALAVPALIAQTAAAQTVAGQTATPADAPAAEPEQAIVVTGIRASIERAIDVKRNSASVVDAI